MKQRTQSAHIPPCHRHMVIATTLSVHCFAIAHCSANQTSAECCIAFITRGGYRVFLGLSGGVVARCAHGARTVRARCAHGSMFLGWLPNLYPVEWPP